MNYPVPDHIKLQKGSEYVSVPGYNYAREIDDTLREKGKFIFIHHTANNTGKTFATEQFMRFHESLESKSFGHHMHIEIDEARTFKIFHPRGLFEPDIIESDIAAAKFALDKGIKPSAVIKAFNDILMDEVPISHTTAIKKFIQEYQPEPFTVPDSLFVKMPESKPFTFTFHVKPKNWWQAIKMYFSLKKWKFSIR